MTSGNFVGLESFPRRARMLHGRPHIYTYARRTRARRTRARRNPDYVTRIRLLDKDRITTQGSERIIEAAFAHSLLYMLELMLIVTGSISIVILVLNYVFSKNITKHDKNHPKYGLLRINDYIKLT